MVVEHLQDPYLVLDEVARILKPGGRFHFSTICRDSFEARFFGEYWRALEVPRHMVFFRRSDIRRALEPNFGKIAAFDQVAARDLVASASWRGKRIDRAFTALGAKGLLPLSIAIALFHGSSRVSFQCVRKGSAAPSRGEQRD
jgi:SAM-dependent methyltransferase